jgi:predicted alpha/beta superfamily hydrolase
MTLKPSTSNWVEMAGLYESHYFDTIAASNGRDYRVFVGGPLGQSPVATASIPGSAKDHRHPTIIVLDGKLNFAMVHAQVQILCALRQLPPAFVIGIGYAGDESFFESDAILRQADLTPNQGGEREKLLREANGASAVAHGGASKFLQFLSDELLPGLADSIAIDLQDLTILGNSLGGLFGTWALFNGSNVFNRYILVSPSFWWNDYEVWEWEAEYAAVNSDLSAKVFLTAGGLETASGHRNQLVRLQAAHLPDKVASLENMIKYSDEHGWPQMAELTLPFERQLAFRNYQSLELNALNLPEETHESIPGAGFSRGLRAVFGSWKNLAPET